MNGDIVARRYAGALFAIATERGTSVMDDYATVLTALAEMSARSLDLGNLLRAPVITAGEKSAVLDILLGKLDADPILNGFCRLLAEKNRLDHLSAIASAFTAMLDSQKGVVSGKVTTAMALSAEKQGKFSKALEQKTGGTVRLAFDVDPDILGGIILHLGDTVMDASLKAQLDALIDTIKRGE